MVTDETFSQEFMQFVNEEVTSGIIPTTLMKRKTLMKSIISVRILRPLSIEAFKDLWDVFWSRIQKRCRNAI